MWWNPSVSPHEVQIKGCAPPIYRVNIQVLSLYSRRPIPVWLYGFMAEYRQYRQYCPIIVCFLARLREVQRAIVVTSVVWIPVLVTHALFLGFHNLTATDQKPFMVTFVYVCVCMCVNVDGGLYVIVNCNCYDNIVCL